MEALKDYFADKDVRYVLDVGTGKGGFLKQLTELFPNADFTGIDPDLESIGEAERSFPGITFKVMSAEKMAFGSDTFDVVSLSMALHHLSGVQKGLKEMKRVLAPGGWIIISELFNDHLTPPQEVQQMYHHFKSRIDRLTGISHRESFEKEQILRMVREAGISVQFYFEHFPKSNFPDLTEEINGRVIKMEQQLDRIRDLPDFYTLQQQIPVFKERARLYGIEPVPRVVLVGRKYKAE